MAKFIFIIIALCIGIYANSIGGEFISDDVEAIEKNPHIGEMPSSGDLPALLNFITYKIGGLNPALYHISSIALHCAVSVLVFYLLLTFFSLWPSFLGVLLFSSHPIHSEAVSWISGKPYPVAGLLILGSFLLYYRATAGEKLKKIPYIFSILFCNPFSVGWYMLLYPGMIIVYDFTYKRVRRNWKLWLPYILIILSWILVKSSAIIRHIDVFQAIPPSVDIKNPFFKIAFSLFEHAKLLFWPVKLSLYHDPMYVVEHFFSPEVGFLFAIAGLSLFLFKKAKPLFFGLGLFVLFLVPSFSPFRVGWIVAERYLYLPSIALAIFAAFVFEKYLSVPKVRNTLAIFIVLIIGAYSLRTFLRNQDWQDKATFCIRSLEASPENPRTHNNMGYLYLTERNYQKAVEEFKTAIALYPDYARAYNNLGIADSALGETKKAIAAYRRAIEISPNYAVAYNNLAGLYASIGRNNQAIAAYKQAIRINPFLSQAHYNLDKLSNALQP